MSARCTLTPITSRLSAGTQTGTMNPLTGLPEGVVWRNGGPTKPIYLVYSDTGDIMGLVMPINLDMADSVLVDLKTIYKEGFINDANVKKGGEGND